MKKKRYQLGFTMAELLIVVAIIAVLGGVGFAAVQTHQRNLAKTEVNTIAKEIFFAAQNHLTMAEAQGYLSPDADISYGESNGAKLTGETAQNIYYFAVNSRAAFTGKSVLDLMLPFGSIDETIRTNGNYVIRYQANPARVLDVWYGRSASEDGGIKGKYTTDPADLITSDSGIQNLADNYNAKVIGHYGGDVALESGVALNAPYIEVVNAERLIVKIKTNGVMPAVIPTDKENNPVFTNADLSVQLIIEGKTSGATAAIPVLPSCYRTAASDEDSFDYEVVLDDITNTFGDDASKSFSEGKGFHFAEILNGVDGISVLEGTAFIPGEDIAVQAIAYSNSKLASITYSNEETTNSLFAEVVNGEAKIANFRHLENLDKRVSGVTVEGNSPIITGAKQAADLVWKQDGNAKAFTTVIPEASVYKLDSTYTAAGYYLPVNIDYALTYDGMETGTEESAEGANDGTNARCHSVVGVKAQQTGSGEAAGLFGTVSGVVTIRNLELIDFNITGTGSAGALAGVVTGTSDKNAKVENVLAHNSSTYDTDKAGAATVTSTAANAGGLIGEMTYCDVSKCAAALIVSGNNNAGGLIGTASGGSVTASYSGGHTVKEELKGGDGTTRTVSIAYDDTSYNVTATNGAAGGLIGVAGTDNSNEMGDVSCCYSTCSVSGKIAAGGFVGTVYGKSGQTIESCYATGLVSAGTNDEMTVGEAKVTIPRAGAFAYSLTSSTAADCKYFEIINEQADANKGAVYLSALGKNASDTNITALDATVADYDAFVGTPTNWKSAAAYDSTLSTYYTVEGALAYPLKTVGELGGTVNGDDEADAETPVDFVVKHYGDWPAPEVFVINEASGD